MSRNEGGLPILSMGEVGSKEYEEFFKERYFKNPSPNIKNYGNKKWEYDESGNLIRYRSFMGDEVDFLETAAEPKEAISKETDFKDHLKEYFNSLDLPLKRRSTVEHILEKEYIYNPEGEWTQCIIRGEKSLGTILATREISHIED